MDVSRTDPTTARPYAGPFVEASEFAPEFYLRTEDRNSPKVVDGRRAGLNEVEAFRRMQKLASEKSRKLADIAAMILVAEEAVQPGDGQATSSTSSNRRTGISRRVGIGRRQKSGRCPP